MIFSIDKQTIKDLELFSQRKYQPSIFSFYNNLVTKGGQELLYEIFNNPSCEIEFLENRKLEINFFFVNNCRLKLNSRSIDFIEYYLVSRRVPLKANIIDATVDGLSNKLNPDSDYFTITEGIIHVAGLISNLNEFIKESKSLNLTKTLASHLEEIEQFLALKVIQDLIDDPPEKASDMSFNKINKLDNTFRVKEKESFRNLLTIVYEIDFLQSMSDLMRSQGLTLPEYVYSSKPIFKVIDSFHPLLINPVKNSFQFINEESLCFLTGPNMSGKSTFLKTIGLLIYISHLGLPVPAKEFKTSIFEGLFTTINLSDDLNLGYSHFYAEVNRVKEVVTKLNSHEKLVIIFDELFRGTNVKDAYDASMMIISLLSKIKDHYFFISTHILEVAENMDNDNKESIIYKCFESEMTNEKPVYNFILKEGISKERVGMKILKKEKIFQILEEVSNKQKQKHSL